MAKAHRGTGIRNLPLHGRGSCPMCKKTGVKVIYDVEQDGQKLKVCKFCNAALKNKARVAAKLAKAQAAAQEPATEEATA